jgi:hypothetical protein
MTVQLDDADKAAVVALLKQAIAADPFLRSHCRRAFGSSRRCWESWSQR